MVRTYAAPLGGEPHFPTAHCKIIKKAESKTGDFLYSVSLWMILDNGRKEIARCDNYPHEGKQKNHIHKFKKDNPEFVTDYGYISIGDTVNYFQENWRQILEQYNG